MEKGISVQWSHWVGQVHPGAGPMPKSNWPTQTELHVGGDGSGGGGADVYVYTFFVLIYFV